MNPRQKKIALLLGALALLATAALVFYALRGNLVFFFTPTQVAAGKAPKDRIFRVGGLVKPGSLKHDELNVRFVVTDTAYDVRVVYAGILPALFREGRGAVVQGKLAADGQFLAAEVLARHDENYMPPAARQAIDSSGKTLKAQKP